jgi:hypothetical protein
VGRLEEENDSESRNGNRAAGCRMAKCGVFQLEAENQSIPFVFFAVPPVGQAA